MKKLILLFVICLLFVQQINIMQAQGVEITSGGKIECVSSASLEIQNGNFINNGTYTMGAETITFSGTTNGNISGSSNNDIYCLTVNNSNGVSLSGTGYFAINKTLVFSMGLINTGSNVIVINDNATVSGASTSKYINGNCRKVGNDAFIFPIGKSGKYAPIGMTAPGNASDHFTATYFNTNPNPLYDISLLGSGLNNVSTKEYWTLDRTNGTSNVKVTLNWDNSSGVSLISELRVARWDGAKWTDAGNTLTSGNTSLGSITSNEILEYSPFTLGSATVSNPLPVDLLSFTAECNNEKVKINWSTATEINCDFFIVEKMFEGESYSFVAKVPGNGNSNQIINYVIEDNHSDNKIAYYRLTQVDFSGLEDVMSDKIISSDCDFPKNDIIIYQDIEGQSIIINSSKETAFIINIFDISGKLISRGNLKLTEKENRINTSDLNLSEGMYLVHFESLDVNKSIKLIIR